MRGHFDLFQPRPLHGVLRDQSPGTGSAAALGAAVGLSSLDIGKHIQDLLFWMLGNGSRLLPAALNSAIRRRPDLGVRAVVRCPLVCVAETS